jgi:hypothetical protein
MRVEGRPGQFVSSSFPTAASANKNGIRHQQHRVHRVAMAAFWPIFHHDGKISPARYWGGGGAARQSPFMIYIITYKVVADTLPLVSTLPLQYLYSRQQEIESTEAESKEKHCVWDPMPKLTITSPYAYSRVNSNTFAISNPMPESALTLSQSRLYPPVRDSEFVICREGSS